MKHLIGILIISVFAKSLLIADDAVIRTSENARLINLALLSLPDRYVSDIPKQKRGDLLLLFSQESGRGRLDYVNGFVDYFRDGAATWDKPSGSCRFWMKLLRGDDGLVLLFVHNDKPDKATEQTVIFRCESYGDFIDVTSSYLPDGIDRASHLRPVREQNLIRVANYERYIFEGKEFPRIGLQTGELVWSGKKFELKKIEPVKIPHLDRPTKIL